MSGEATEAVLPQKKKEKKKGLDEKLISTQIKHKYYGEHSQGCHQGETVFVLSSNTV